MFISPPKCCRYSLGVPQRGASHEYPQHVCEEIRKIICIRTILVLLVEKASSLEVCSTFNIKTGSLILPLLGSTKSGLDS